MRILLRADVENVGRRGDVVDVADGYARNFLMPRGLAVPATRGAIKQAEAMRRAREAREVRERAAIEAVAEALRGRRVRVAARAGEGGRLFGSVTAADVAEAVEAQLSVALDRRKIDLAEPLRRLGVHEVSLKIHPEVTVTFTVEVVAEGRRA